MTATQLRKQPTASQPIPSTLIHEIIDGKPVYLKNYKEVLSGDKTIEEIMGSSTLQSMIIEFVLRQLFRKLDENKYHILTNEQGLHLDKGNNLSGDITIFESKDLPLSAGNKHYAQVAPLIDIEVDVDIDTENFDSPESYIFIKTQKLLNFGVKKVLWISTSSKKVIVATPNENWQIIDWNKDIEIHDGIMINIGNYLREGGSPFA
ncbi:MAG: Uma2 family endonuclease [Spirosomaceae bacterium]|nr:Uma2 family endonuclease [Spirosomataceae bacterium]